MYNRNIIPALWAAVLILSFLVTGCSKNIQEQESTIRLLTIEEKTSLAKILYNRALSNETMDDQQFCIETDFQEPFPTFLDFAFKQDTQLYSKDLHELTRSEKLFEILLKSDLMATHKKSKKSYELPDLSGIYETCPEDFYERMVAEPERYRYFAMGLSVPFMIEDLVFLETNFVCGYFCEVNHLLVIQKTDAGGWEVLHQDEIAIS